MIKKGDRVKVDFISESRTIYSGKRFTGYGVVDRFEDGRVFGRLDDGRTFMCFEGDVALVGRDGEEVMRENFEKLIASSPSYLKLVFQHGERLFIFEDGQYKIAAVQLAWELEQHRQSEVNELKQDYSKAKLSDIQHTTLAFDVINERDDLQKRLDAAQKVADKMVKGTISVSMFAYELERALNGGSDEAN